jgi:hypothetical protein
MKIGMKENKTTNQVVLPALIGKLVGTLDYANLCEKTANQAGPKR